MNDKHPTVSEDHEGTPLCEWIVAACAVLGGVMAVLDHTMAATVIISVAAIGTGLLRLLLRERSPWKVRSVAFDSFIGIALGIGLLVTYFSIRLLI